MAFADINGARLFYTDDGDGPALLLVHGSSCDSFDWNYQLPALQGRYRVIALHRRGHGHSSAPDRGYAPREEAADLAALLDTLGVPRAVAVGHSTGGALVAALAIQHPERVRALVAVDPSYGINPAAREVFRAIAATLDGPGVHETWRSMGDGWYVPASPAHLRAWHMRRVYTVPPHVLAAGMRETALSDDQFFFSPETEAYLSNVRCPVHTVRRVGEGLPSAEWDMAQFTHPYSKAVAWSDAGHFLHQERPREFNGILTGWIDGLPA